MGTLRLGDSVVDPKSCYYQRRIYQGTRPESPVPASLAGRAHCGDGGSPLWLRLLPTFQLTLEERDIRVQPYMPGRDTPPKQFPGHILGTLASCSENSADQTEHKGRRSPRVPWCPTLSCTLTWQGSRRDGLVSINEHQPLTSRWWAPRSFRRPLAVS